MYVKKSSKKKLVFKCFLVRMNYWLGGDKCVILIIKKIDKDEIEWSPCHPLLLGLNHIVHCIAHIFGDIINASLYALISFSL